MVEAVPAFLGKVARYRPRIVCFVGFGIWQIVERGLLKIAAPPEAHSAIATPTADTNKGKNSSRTPNRKSLGSNTRTKMGLRPYKMIHSKPQNGNKILIKCHVDSL